MLNGQLMAVEKSTVSGFPFVIEIAPQNGIELKFNGVVHEKHEDKWQHIPVIDGKKST